MGNCQDPKQNVILEEQVAVPQEWVTYLVSAFVMVLGKTQGTRENAMLEFLFIQFGSSQIRVHFSYEAQYDIHTYTSKKA